MIINFASKLVFRCLQLIVIVMALVLAVMYLLMSIGRLGPGLTGPAVFMMKLTVLYWTFVIICGGVVVAAFLEIPIVILNIREDIHVIKERLISAPFRVIPVQFNVEGETSGDDASPLLRSGGEQS